jgi:hypothetical protein
LHADSRIHDFFLEINRRPARDFDQIPTPLSLLSSHNLENPSFSSSSPAPLAIMVRVILGQIAVLSVNCDPGLQALGRSRRPTHTTPCVCLGDETEQGQWKKCLMVVGADSALLRRWMSRARGVPVNLSASRALACIYSVINSSHVQLEGGVFARRGGEGLEDDSIRADPTA